AAARCSCAATALRCSSSTAPTTTSCSTRSCARRGLHRRNLTAAHRVMTPPRCGGKSQRTPLKSGGIWGDHERCAHRNDTRARMKMMKQTMWALLVASGCVDDPAQTVTDDPVQQPQERAPAGPPHTFTPLVNQPPVAITVPILLRDGNVIAQEVSTSNWYKLTPDAL